jgi:siroheme synthase
LLTIKGARCLSMADTALSDDTVSAQLTVRK